MSLIIDHKDINVDVELKHISAFLTVARTLNFRRAADILYMTQPGLTRIIKRLENEIGVQLFNRSTRSVELTEAGEVFLTEIRPAIEKIGQAIDKAQSAAAGNIGYLSIAYMGFAINGPLPGILRRFHQSHPGIRTDLVYLPTKEQKKMIIDSEIDIGFLIGPVELPGVVHRVVSRERLMAVMPENHPFVVKKEVPISDLRDEPLILGSPKDWSSFVPMIVDLCQKSDFNPKIRQYADTSEGIFGMVAAGLGVTIYTESAINIHQHGLITRPLTDQDAIIETVAAWLQRNKSPCLQKMKQVLEEFAPPGRGSSKDRS